MSHAIVSGGTGFLGSHLVDRLLEARWEVTLLTRDGSRVCERHRDAVSVLVANLNEPLPSLPPAEVFFHCAADMDFGHGTRQMAEVTVNGTWHALIAAQKARLGRFVHVSSQAVYGFDRHYYDADETTPLRRSPWAYCETKRQAEEAVWSLAAEGLPVTVVRPGFVYGPGDRRSLPPVVKLLQGGQLKAHIDWGEFDTGCLHVSNCAEGLFLAGTREEATNQAYHLGDGRILTIRQVVDTLARALDVPAPQGNMPFPVAMGLGALVNGAWKLLRLSGPAPMSPFLVAMLHRNSGFSIAKARRELGYVPRRQWEESLGETIAWCEEAG